MEFGKFWGNIYFGMGILKVLRIFRKLNIAVQGGGMERKNSATNKEPFWCLSESASYAKYADL